MMKTFKSRVGWEIFVPVGLVLLIIGYLSFVTGIWLSVIVVTLVAAFITVIVINTTYAITHDHKLIIRCWILINQEIDIQSIRKIEKTTNPISSPAPSLLGRLELQYGNGNYVIISPKNKKTFIDNLLHINKSILVKGVF